MATPSGVEMAVLASSSQLPAEGERSRIFEAQTVPSIEALEGFIDQHAAAITSSFEGFASPGNSGRQAISRISRLRGHARQERAQQRVRDRETRLATLRGYVNLEE